MKLKSTDWNERKSAKAQRRKDQNETKKTSHKGTKFTKMHREN